MKNVFGLNVIFSVFTSTSTARSTVDNEDGFTPSPSVVSRARMARRVAKIDDRLDETRKAS